VSSFTKWDRDAYHRRVGVKEAARRRGGAGRRGGLTDTITRGDSGDDPVHAGAGPGRRASHYPRLPARGPTGNPAAVIADHRPDQRGAVGRKPHLLRRPVRLTYFRACSIR